jgi:hypothetical protein
MADFGRMVNSIKRLVSLGLQNLLFLNFYFGGCSPDPLLPWVCPCPGARRLNRMESVTCISITKTSLSVLCSEIPHLMAKANAFCGQNVGFCGTSSNGGLYRLSHTDCVTTMRPALLCKTTRSHASTPNASALTI